MSKVGYPLAQAGENRVPGPLQTAARRERAMADLFASGRIIDLILIALALEVGAIGAYRGYRGRGIRASELVATAAAGACLLLALRGALAGAAWAWIAGWLLLGLGAHVADVSLRWAHDRR